MNIDEYILDILYEEYSNKEIEINDLFHLCNDISKMKFAKSLTRLYKNNLIRVSEKSEFTYIRLTFLVKPVLKQYNNIFHKITSNILS